MELETRIGFNRDYDFNGPKAQVQILKRECATPTAELAFSFIERWGMVAAMDGGEDSVGRAKLRLATPEEVVERAFVMARLAQQKAFDEGLIVALPGYAELDAAEAQRNAEKAAAKEPKVKA